MADKDECVELVRRAADAKGAPLTKSEYQEWRSETEPTPLHPNTISKEIGSWAEVCVAADLEITREAAQDAGLMPDWDREAVVEKLDEWLQDNEAKSDNYTGDGYNRPSMSTVYDHFDSWPEAVEAAGHEALSTTSRRYTREDVVEIVDKAIQMYEDGIPGYTDYLEIDISPRPTQHVIQNYFEGWSHLVYELGYAPNSYNGLPKECYREMLQEVIEDIGRMPQKGEYNEHRGDRPSGDAVIRNLECDSWVDVVREMGHDPTKLYTTGATGKGNHVTYDKSDYLDELELLIEREGHINSTDFREYLQEESHLPREGWRNLWEGWAEVADEVGLELDVVNLTVEELRERIHSTAEELGRAPQRTEVVERSECGDQPFKTKLSDSWNEELEYLGYEPLEARTKCTAQECIDGVQRVAEELGAAPKAEEYKELHTDEEPSLKTIRKFHGTFAECKQNAGLEIESAIDTSPEACLNGLQQAIDELGKVPTRKEYDEYRKENNLCIPSSPVIQRRIGTMNEAIRKLGYEPNHEMNKWDRSDMVEAIHQTQDMLGIDRPPKVREMYEVVAEHSIEPSPVAIIREFGKWNDALEAAGYEKLNFDPSTNNGDYDDAGHYYGPNWYPRKKSVCERDGECQLCGHGNDEHVEEFGCQLHVHHIVPFKEFKPDPDYQKANAYENLITVCYQCHHKLEGIIRNEGIDAQYPELPQGRWRDVRVTGVAGSVVADD